MKIFIFFHIKYNYVNPFKEINDFITKNRIISLFDYRLIIILSFLFCSRHDHDMYVTKIELSALFWIEFYIRIYNLFIKLQSKFFIPIFIFLFLASRFPSSKEIYVISIYIIFSLIISRKWEIKKKLKKFPIFYIKK